LEILVEQAVIPGAAPDFWESAANHALYPASKKEGASRALAAIDRLGGKGRVLFSTSGTTGQPKWVVLPKSAILGSARLVVDWLGLSEDDRFLCALPRYHVGGAGLLARAHLLDAEVWVTEGKWDPVAFCKIIERMQISVTSLVPSQLWDIVHKGLRAPSAMEVMVVGGGALDPAIASEARQLNWPVLASFGMTEAASQIATEACRMKSHGWSVEGWLPVIEGWEVRTGRDERLSIRGPGLCEGYWHERVPGDWHLETCADEDGWFLSADLADVSLDAAGRQWLMPRGRVDDQVKIHGELVRLGDMRKELIGIARGYGLEPEHFYVIDVPDERKGCSLYLAAEQGEWEAHLNNVLEIFNARVPGYARLEGVRLVANLPRGSMGKVRREELRRSCLDADK